jgi:hypothetical protein
VINDENLDRTFLRFQLLAKLPLDGRQEGRPGDLAPGYVNSGLGVLLVPSKADYLLGQNLERW